MPSALRLVVEYNDLKVFVVPEVASAIDGLSSRNSGLLLQRLGETKPRGWAQHRSVAVEVGESNLLFAEVAYLPASNDPRYTVAVVYELRSTLGDQPPKNPSLRTNIEKSVKVVVRLLKIFGPLLAKLVG